MKQIEKQVKEYVNFNESQAVQVSRINLNGTEAAGICRYTEAYNCSFFLHQPCITYVVSGEKYMLADKKEYHLKKGDLLYLPGHQVVFSDIPKTEEVFISFNLRFTKSLLQQLEDLVVFGPARLSNVAFAWQQSGKVMGLFEDFLQYGFSSAQHEFTSESFRKFIAAVLSLCKNELFRTGSGSSLRGEDEQNMTRALLKYLYEPVPLKLFASESYMSLATFKRKFEQVFGVPPKTWIRDTRLHAAYFHLKTNRERISAISSYVGFENPAHFSYTFKKYFQVRPSGLY